MEEFNKEQLEKSFSLLQKELVGKTDLKNYVMIEKIRIISGIDLAYWEEDGSDYAVCCIVSIDYKTQEIVEIKHCVDKITVPYIAGYLSFRELPLICKTYKLLDKKPDVAMFDGNGVLHYCNMGIATHASFQINIPTIGVAKSYLKVDGVDFTMPKDEVGCYSDIVIKNQVSGRALRTRKGVKPIFISCGNWIDLETTTKIVLSLVEHDSRLPVPTRLADIETRKQRKALIKIKN